MLYCIWFHRFRLYQYQFRLEEAKTNRLVKELLIGFASINDSYTNPLSDCYLCDFSQSKKIKLSFSLRIKCQMSLA